MAERNPKKNKNNKSICPRCKGNGYFKVPHKSVEELDNSVTVQCPMCNSEGELDDKNNTIIIDADGIHRLQ
jgi:DnaJ-class molecular chaperone